MDCDGGLSLPWAKPSASLVKTTGSISGGPMPPNYELALASTSSFQVEDLMYFAVVVKN